VWIGSRIRRSEEYRSAGDQNRHPAYELTHGFGNDVDDLDGNILRLGSDPKPDETFGGMAWTCMAIAGWGANGRE